VKTGFGAAAMLIGGVTIASAASAQEGASIAAPTCDYGEASPLVAAELAQFDFLIGDFTISAHAWQNGAWSPPRPGIPSRWNGRYGLGGFSIIDDWYGRDPGMQPDTPRGTNIRMWDADAGEWDMAWIHTGTNQVQDLRAKMEGGKLTMWQAYPERPGFRAYFERTGPDSWHRISLIPDEKGGWTPQFKLAAVRIPCPED